MFNDRQATAADRTKVRTPESLSRSLSGYIRLYPDINGYTRIPKAIILI